MGEEQKKIIEEYLKQGKAGAAYKAFLKLFRGNKSEHQLKRRMKADWDAISSGDYYAADLKPILHKIHFIINSESDRPSGKSKIRYVLEWYSRVAAILLLPILVISVTFLLFNQQATSEPSLVKVVVPMGSRVETELPDGTNVWLNSGTKLSYSIPFEKRKVKMEGEAFFDVKTDSLNPFTVQGEHGAISVLGTRFNAKMWPDEELTEVVLEEGKVGLHPRQCDKTYLMSPGEMLVFNSKARTLTRKKVTPEHYSAWIDGKLMLRGETITQMARELSRWFNVEVVIEDSTIHDYTFRATFENQKLEDVLRLLKMTSPIEYKIIDNQQDKSGNFSKKKVIIRHQ